MNSLVNFLTYTLAYARKSVGNPHFGWVERLGLFWLLMQLLVKSKYHADKPVIQRGFGFTMFAPDPQLLLQLVLEIFVDGIYYFESEKTAPKIIDGGANIGISVLYFKYLYPQAHIVAIEPNPAALVYLERNIKENKLSQITLIPAALSAESGEGNLHYSPCISLLNASLMHDSEVDRAKVSTHKLSDYLRGNQIDLVKLDIEGAEEQVIGEIADQGEIHNAKQYIVEYHPSADSPSGRILLESIFKGIGYTLDEKSPDKGTESAPTILNFLYKAPRFLPVYHTG
ncbi:FkbM family methyltransferase [Lunatibacter salilacus]|uniref:FkbM family methyltransferase n=1 Tax=Lunatibacter salilacus TaxID=2483804 RepID=UPI00131A8545|nr:FkbM family methyltransferase [Lunatibacter salilacus]